MGNSLGSMFGSKHEAKVILITGASSGIGKECALTLIRRGHILYGAARRVDHMQDLVEAGGHAIRLDVTNDQDIIDAVQRILNEQGRIDVLVNNAGYGVHGAVEDVSMEDARRQFDVNLFGLARLTKEVLPHMRHAKKGTIINISSAAARFYLPCAAWYHASKHALEGWSDCLRVEVAPFNIKVAIVVPGGIQSEMADDIMATNEERSKGSPYELYSKKLREQVEMAKPHASHPSVIANVVVHASESKHPKRRYVAGLMAGPILFARNWLGDGFLDFVIRKTITQN